MAVLQESSCVLQSEATATSDEITAIAVSSVIESDELLPRILAHLPRHAHKRVGGMCGELADHCCLVCCAHVSRHFWTSSEQVYREIVQSSKLFSQGCLTDLSWRRQYRICKRLPRVGATSLP